VTGWGEQKAKVKAGEENRLEEGERVVGKENKGL
jgi:hypothetical protein